MSESSRPPTAYKTPLFLPLKPEIKRTGENRKRRKLAMCRYLEATLRRARRDEKAAARVQEHSFQPLTNSVRRSFSAAPIGHYYYQSEKNDLSRHEILYMDGEQKRQRNIDARLDPSQKGTGELVFELNRQWSDSSERSKLLNPLLRSRQEDGFSRR